VLLTSATFAYYRDGKLVPRLHEEIVEPALRGGYRRIWLAGASLGGMGALLYEREYPGELTGLVLFAPFLGGKELLDEIRAAGGPRKWDPGPLPAETNATIISVRCGRWRKAGRPGPSSLAAYGSPAARAIA